MRFLIPYNIIAFCANALVELLEQPQEKIDQYQLMPWIDLKQLIFDVYDHRLENAAEVNGLANTSYCALNEYILIYMIDVYKDRKVAEKQLVDIFINLRYFYDQQVRAKMFCQNLEIVFMKNAEKVQ